MLAASELLPRGIVPCIGAAMRRHQQLFAREENLSSLASDYRAGKAFKLVEDHPAAGQHINSFRSDIQFASGYSAVVRFIQGDGIEKTIVDPSTGGNCLFVGRHVHWFLRFENRIRILRE